MESERKLFKFYRSYFDVASELPDKDRLLFYDAIMQRQFFGNEPNLKGIAKLAYISQKFNVDAQVKGWEDKMKIQLSENHPTQPPIEPPSIQVEVKEKEEVKEKREKTKVFSAPTFDEAKKYFNENGYSDAAAQAFVKYYDAGDWTDSKGNKVKNWKQKAQSVWFKDENKIIEAKKQSDEIKLNDYFIPNDELFGYSQSVLIERCKQGLYKKL